MSGRLFLALAITAVSAAIIAGVLIVGGPMQGRHDKFDNRRYLELGKLARALFCVRHARVFRALPAELTVKTLRIHCSSAGITAADLLDDETGEPYSYTTSSTRDFSVCATFHDAERTVRLNRFVQIGASFDPITGCVSGRTS